MVSVTVRAQPFVLSLLAGFLSTGLLFGETESSDTRAESWRRQRLQKQIQPYRQKGLEKSLLYLEKKGFQEILDINFKGFYPKFANLSTGSGFAPGVRFWKPNIGGSLFDLQSSANFSTRGYEQYELQFGNFYLGAQEYFLGANLVVSGPQLVVVTREKKSFLYGAVRYRHFPQEDFFGVGPESSESDRTNYLLQDTAYVAVFGYQFERWLGVGARTGFLQSDVGSGTDERYPSTETLFDDQSAPGLAEQPDFFHLSTAVFFDFRDLPGKPHKGGLLGLSYSRFDDLDDNQFQFNRYAFDARGYLPLGSVARVFAVRFFASFDDAPSGSRVPFYLQDTLGGSQTLRGFREFRFRDTNLMYLSGEYRWEAAPAIEGAFFYDAGKVFNDRSDFDFAGLEKSYGVGVRFKTKNAVVFRFDIGRSNEGTRIFFKFAPTF